MQVLNNAVLNHIAGGQSTQALPPRHPNSVGNIGMANKAWYGDEAYAKYNEKFSEFMKNNPDYVESGFGVWREYAD